MQKSLIMKVFKINSYSQKTSLVKDKIITNKNKAKELIKEVPPKKIPMICVGIGLVTPIPFGFLIGGIIGSIIAIYKKLTSHKS